MLKLGAHQFLLFFLYTYPSCLSFYNYNKQLKDLEVLIRFPRFPECPFLLHCVEHSVAILSLVLVRETDDRQLSVILYYVYISQNL